MYKNLVYTNTADLTPEAWEKMRQGLKTIGGSDAASILGLNDYQSPYGLWCEKTGKITPEDISSKEAVRLGNDLEQYVAERWCEKTGKKVRRRMAVITNPELEFAHANVDRLVVGEDAGLECKTTSSWDIAQQCRDGKFPDRYYCQCVHYLLVTGAERWHLGILCFGSGFYEFTIERNEDEIAALEEAERTFWRGVITDTPPALDGTEATTEAVKTIYKESAPGSSIDLTAVGHHIESYNALGKQIRELETMRSEHENCIKDFMQTSERGSFGNTSISWKSGTRKSFDKAAFEADNGRIADKYYNVTNTRSFRVTVKN